MTERNTECRQSLRTLLARRADGLQSAQSLRRKRKVKRARICLKGFCAYREVMGDAAYTQTLEWAGDLEDILQDLRCERPPPAGASASLVIRLVRRQLLFDEEGTQAIGNQINCQRCPAVDLKSNV
jgi:hypothetical protein